MAARFTTDSLNAAHAVLTGAATPAQAVILYKVSRPTVYRVTARFSPYDRENKKKLKKLLQR